MWLLKKDGMGAGKGGAERPAPPEMPYGEKGIQLDASAVTAAFAASAKPAATAVYAAVGKSAPRAEPAAPAKPANLADPDAPARPDFYETCRMVGLVFENQWKATGDAEKTRKLEREKNAILGEAAAVDFYKEEILRILEKEGLTEVASPPWYKSLADGVFAELYGLSGLAPWVYDETPEYAASSSAKLIGDKLFCLIDGETVLQPQRISAVRREQLKRAFLMSTPRERLETGFHEVYLHNGIRISIFSGSRTKKGQDVFVLRKYLVRELTLEKLAEFGTFPKEAVPLFHAMIRVGFNVVFSGPVRSGKTTFLRAWQLCEDRRLEGLAIATDPETPWHELMPDAPIMQLVADDRELESIGKPILRGDNDYVMLEEMRNAVAFKLALELTSQGTQRSKVTVHARDGISLPYKMAAAIKSKYGDDMRGTLQQIFKNFNYVFEFMQLGDDRSKKRLKAVVEYCYDARSDRVEVHKICSYDVTTDSWQWNCHIGEDKEEIGMEKKDALNEMRDILESLAAKNPMGEGRVSYPRYYSPDMRNKKWQR